jgi:hypothetical protein
MDPRADLNHDHDQGTMTPSGIQTTQRVAMPNRTTSSVMGPTPLLPTAPSLEIELPACGGVMSVACR